MKTWMKNLACRLLGIPLPHAEQFDTSVQMLGHVKAELFGPDGILKGTWEQHNLVTDVGDNYMTGRFYSGATAPVMTNMKLGSASTAASKNGAGSFVAVADYIAGSAHACDESSPKVGASPNIAQWIHTWAAGEATGTIRRVGIVDNTTNAGEADATHTFSMSVFSGDIPKGASDTLKVTWTVTTTGT